MLSHKLVIAAHDIGLRFFGFDKQLFKHIRCCPVVAVHHTDKFSAGCLYAPVSGSALMVVFGGRNDFQPAVFF